MAATRDLHFPLAIMCLVFIRGYCPLPTTFQRMLPMRSNEAPLFSTEDYSIFEEESTTTLPNRVTPDGRTLPRCDYNPCLEGETPCLKVAATNHCLCPGFTSDSVAPEAPTLKSVFLNGSEVVLKWCAPYSHVTAYIVTVGEQLRQSFGEAQRSGAVGKIDDIAEICVMAVNNAGESLRSCEIYQPRDNSLSLTAGLIGGALGFLLLLLLVVLLWWHRRQRKQEATISMNNTD